MSELLRIVQDHIDRTGVSEAGFSRRIGAAPQTVNAWKQRGIRGLPDARLLHGVSDVTGRPYSEVLNAALIDMGYVAAGSNHAAISTSDFVELVLLIDEVYYNAEQTDVSITEEAELDDISAMIAEFEDFRYSAQDLSRFADQLMVAVYGSEDAAKRARQQARREQRRRQIAMRERGSKLDARSATPPLPIEVPGATDSDPHGEFGPNRHKPLKQYETHEVDPGLDSVRPEDEKQSDYAKVARTRDPRVRPEIPDEPDWPADPEGPEGGA